jgi:hypothetical protein
MVRLVHFALDCAPLERETLVGREVYKHLAPLEPEQCLVWSTSALSLSLEISAFTGKLKLARDLKFNVTQHERSLA